ncbi:pentatricopeptide repeat-containing protein At5g61800 [Impatiens glandulifera]|uniref:pentatricopeptide repeat-containing protein At5g61800 n=1 Tax=Impatiens glandulifera TaxID=253017 RepID=UPI001FB157F2|nr:pentatricopeptide repeat-containing protein At5g61800 [Impatiens glandulifera]
MLTRKLSMQHPLHTLKKCKSIKQLFQVHAQSITRGFFYLHPSSSSSLLTSILHSFTSLPLSSSLHPTHLLHYVSTVFHLIANPSTFCYNHVIRSHTLLRFPLHGLHFYTQMRRSGLLPDFHTFPFVIKACAELRSIHFGPTLHCQCIRFGFLADVFVVNCLVNMYSAFGRVYDACQVFDGSLYRDVYGYNSLIDGFVKAGETKRARQLFDEMPQRDAVSWASLLAGYSHNSQLKEAIELFDLMFESKVCPDNVALVSVLSACGQLGMLEKGKTIHSYIEQNGIKIDTFLLTALVDLYSKCGCIETATNIFNANKEKNLFTWNAMLGGLAMNGYGHLLLNYFSRMMNNGVKPDGVTFLSLLVGCSHSGLLNEAKKLFEEMEIVYGVPKELKHYGSMADLFGRSGCIREAEEMIDGMPIDGDLFVWGSLLSGCRKHGIVDVAEKAAGRVMKIKPEDGGVYSIMADVYVNAERWDDLENVRRLRDVKRVKKIAGCSVIQLEDGTSYEFIAGDDMHPMKMEIYQALNGIAQHVDCPF